MRRPACCTSPGPPSQRPPRHSSPHLPHRCQTLRRRHTYYSLRHPRGHPRQYVALRHKPAPLRAGVLAACVFHLPLLPTQPRPRPLPLPPSGSQGGQRTRPHHMNQGLQPAPPALQRPQVPCSPQCPLLPPAPPGRRPPLRLLLRAKHRHPCSKIRQRLRPPPVLLGSCRRRLGPQCAPPLRSPQRVFHAAGLGPCRPLLRLPLYPQGFRCSPRPHPTIGLAQRPRLRAAMTLAAHRSPRSCSWTVHGVP